MKKAILLLIILYTGSLLANSIVTNRHVSYNSYTKTLSFTGGVWDNRFILPLQGDLTKYRALHFDCKNASSSFRIIVEYYDIDGTLCSKTFYQYINTPKSCVKEIILSDNPDFMYCGEITRIQISMINGDNYIELNGIYLEDLKRNKTEIRLE